MHGAMGRRARSSYRTEYVCIMYVMYGARTVQFGSLYDKRLNGGAHIKPSVADL